MKTISIICPTYNEEKYIEGCIASIIASDYDKGRMEVIFVDGMSTDATRRVISGYAAQYPFIRMIDNPARVTPNALNIGIQASVGEVIVRLDAHALYPPAYFSVLVHYLDQLHADNVGVAYRSVPVKDTLMCKAIAVGVSSPFGVGNSYCRLGTDRLMQVDTVPFGCFNRELFDRIGFFDEELIRNQDDEFNARIINNGGTIFIIPDITIDYFSRDSLPKIAGMFYQYGLFKPLVNKKLGKPATLRQFAPVAFVAGVIVTAIGSVFSHAILVALFAGAGVYLLAALCFSFRHSLVQADGRIALWMPLVFLVMHIAYGWGYFDGIYRIICKRSFHALHTR